MSSPQITELPNLPWVHIQDPQDRTLDRLAEQYALHELDVEDCRHRRQMAKVAEHAGYSFIVIKTIEYSRETREIAFHDFDLFVLRDALVTVAEGKNTIVQRTQARLPQEPEFHSPQGIAYLLIDFAVDEFLPVLDEVGDLIEDLEDQVIERPTPAVLQKIFVLKRLLIDFRRNTAAMREVLNHLMRMARPEQQGSLYPYYRDVYDHLVRSLDFIESYRDLLTGSLDIYLSAIANRTNDVMKLLTIYGTISIPLVVITGFFGMNVHLPMQDWPRAVYVVLAVLAASTVPLLVYFWRKKWL